MSLFTACLFALSSASTFAADKDMYVGAEFGFVHQEDSEILGSDTDVPTRCDQLLRSTASNDDRFVDLNQNSLDGECRRAQDIFDAANDIDYGLLVGFQLGYRLSSNVRAELEYIFNTHSGGDIEETRPDGGEKEAEMQLSAQGLEGMASHSFMANMFYDFGEMHDKFTPYLGAGIGFSEVDVEYVAIFARNLNPDGLGPVTPPAAAGVATVTNETLSDTVFVWQLMGGVDYEISDQWSVGLKARYMVFEDVEDSNTWDRLRSHDSAIATAEYAASIGIDPTVEYDISVEDIVAWAVGANLKYHF